VAEHRASPSEKRPRSQRPFTRVVFFSLVACFSACSRRRRW